MGNILISNLTLLFIIIHSSYVFFFTFINRNGGKLGGGD